MPNNSQPLPSRRIFASLLTAGAGMAALAACTPEDAAPSPVAANAASEAPSLPTPSSVGTPSAAASEPAPVESAPSATPSNTAPSHAVAPQHSLTDPTSPWVVVNKHRPLVPQDFVPADLVQPGVRLAVSGEAALLNSTTATAAEKMFGAAATEGVNMTLASGYRSYSTQVATYNGYVASTGQAAADRASARPGHSEHQTGWSFDIGDGAGACSFQPCFAEQPAAIWAKANAHKFGFVVRYPWMFHDTTGYFYESWHLRYIGVEAATDMTARGIATLEEYFGLEAAPDYF
ncbi:D-alanyl-D-alanine carboxypeptidase family protein [Paenarthrobacter sp. TYUT067]|uniref:M15 family metallopeptidase n=1 Tax=Paenarthrobacter sp. TYUT067 TaxID=2926245 RepID=UPI002030B912|nr:D-alanyl-D-alanine carboxypeptidase family protein [Paenarthrobacter sp. TYUT067]MCM0615670.1 D-alanyl-D-alanine carboxypeptidase family protein [Paenarthrobacter sp. TYUT067]